MNEAVINLECKPLLKVALQGDITRRAPHWRIYL